MAKGQGGALTRRATLAGAAAGFGAVAFVNSAKAQVAPKTFVLVHGSWHGGVVLAPRERPARETGAQGVYSDIDRDSASARTCSTRRST